MADLSPAPASVWPEAHSGLWIQTAVMNYCWQSQRLYLPGSLIPVAPHQPACIQLPAGQARLPAHPSCMVEQEHLTPPQALHWVKATPLPRGNSSYQTKGRPNKSSSTGASAWGHGLGQGYSTAQRGQAEQQQQQQQGRSRAQRIQAFIMSSVKPAQYLVLPQ